MESSSLVVIKTAEGAEYLAEGFLLVRPERDVISTESPTGPCSPLVRCRFGGCHKPHSYGEGRCPGKGR